MSNATSIRGRKYEQNFRKGFVRRNAAFMSNPALEVENNIVYGVVGDGMRGSNPIGDIDGYYVASETKFLRDLLPVEHRLSNYDFAINEGDEVFFELTTQSGDDLWKTPAAYIQKKVSFHEALTSGGAHGWSVDKAKHVLIFCFNGADNVMVAKSFRTACDVCGIRGTTVYLASDIVDQWALQLQLDEKQYKLEESKHKLDETKHELEESKHKLDETKHELEESKHKLDETKHELDEKTHELDEAKSTIAQLLARLSIAEQQGVRP